MKVSAYTAGRWIAHRVRKGRLDDDQSFVDAGFGIWSDKPSGFGGTRIVPDGLSEADAHLISAAPDLLAALQGLMGFFCAGDWEPGQADQIDAARAAIAKATATSERSNAG